MNAHRGRELVAASRSRCAPRRRPSPASTASGCARDDGSCLHRPSGYLSYLATGVEPSGIEQRSAINLVTDVRRRDVLAGEPRIELGTFNLAVEGRSSRGRWELRFNWARSSMRAGAPGHVDGRARRSRPPRLLPATAAVEPSELARYAAPARPRRQPCSSARVRSSALDGARLCAGAKVAVGLPDDELVRLVPALRWLGGERDLGGDPRLARGCAAHAAAAASGREQGGSTRPDR